MRKGDPETTTDGLDGETSNTFVVGKVTTVQLFVEGEVEFANFSSTYAVLV